MILKELRRKLDLNWVNNNKVWDIVVYGSFSRGNTTARDLDIAVILSVKSSASTKMKLSQELRRRLSFKEWIVDVKTVDISDLLNPGFLGREAILSEGQSLLKKSSIASRFGFSAVSIIEYDMSPLTISQKKMLYYALQGRKKGTGLLAQLNGKIISKGVLIVPTSYYEEIKDLLEAHGTSFRTNFMLQYRVLT